jgi:hypothetical protein
MADAEARGDGERRQQMRGVEQSDIELIADVRPRHFAHQFDRQPFFRGKALVHRDDQSRRVDQWNETNAQAIFDHFKSSAAVTTDCATSAIFLFSFIAVLRSKA